jgi:hypothetical protein
MEEILNVFHLIHLLELFLSFIFKFRKKNDYHLRSLGERELSLKNSSVLIYFVVIELSSGHDVEDD